MASTDPISASTSNPQPSNLPPSSSLLPSIEWSFTGNKQFDSVISVLFDDSYPDPEVFEKSVTGNPGMTLAQMEQKLMDDMEGTEINAGLAPAVPQYLNNDKMVVPEPSRDLVPWTQEEHRLYFEGMNKEHGNGYNYIEESSSPTENNNLFFEDSNFYFGFHLDFNRLN